MQPVISSLKSKLSFEVGRNPRLAPRPADYGKFLPSGVDAVVILSADFELAWAWRFAKGLEDPSRASEAFARRARQNLPVLLELCRKYDIPITWATVGHLFLEDCRRDDAGVAHPECLRLPYFENAWWSYQEGDWFDLDPCTTAAGAEAWYGPDLVQQILDEPVAHEIGCHTFSHIDCTDAICPPEVLASELAASQAAADRFGIQLRSFVFPGHTMGNFGVLREHGYTAVRTNYVNEIGWPRRHADGLWRFAATSEINQPPGWNRRYVQYRFRKIISRTLKYRAFANLWFHPSLDPETVSGLFEPLFAEIRRHGDRVWVTTMADYTRWLQEREIS